MLGANCKRLSATVGGHDLHDPTQRVGRHLYCNRVAWRCRFQYAIAKNGNAAYSVDREARRQPGQSGLMIATMGQGILAFPSALAQDECERIVKRVQDGRKAAK